MKKILALTLVALGLAALKAQAQSPLTNLNIITVALTLQSQGSVSDDGTTRIYTTPTTRKVATKDLLNQLARDKFAQTNYPANAFPSGAKLAVFNGAVIVVNGNNQFLANVSDIIQITTGTNDILSGKINDTTGLATSQTTELVVLKFNFDDRAIPGGGNFSFYVQGIDTIKTSDTKPVSQIYHETASDTVNNASGEGQSSGTAFVITGSLQGSRTAKLSL